MKRGVANILIFVFLVTGGSLFAQVNKIKDASKNNSSSSSSGGDRGGRSTSGSSSFIFFDLFGNGLVQWQRQKLQNRHINPRIVSLEFPMQAALQPSSYYLFTPRFRGNWGLFSTDLRVNYLLEQDINGLKDLATIDWQVIQLNLVTSKNVIGRIGGGTMTESFGDNRSFFESTIGLSVLANDQIKGGAIEYRLAKDFETEAVPRREFNLHYEHRIFSTGFLHGYATVGGVYQRYYNAISVWGIQGGIIFRVHASQQQEKDASDF